MSLYLALLPAVKATTGQVVSTRSPVDHGHRPALSCDTSVTFCDSTLNTANLCPAISVVGLFYLLTVIMNFVCRFILGVDFTRRFRFCMCA